MDDMTGKTVLITGATDGIGKAVMRELASSGARVVGVGRDLAKIERTLDELRRVARDGNIAFLEADLSDMGQVRRLAAQFQRDYDRLDVLINNAGALFTTRRETVDGFEMTFALNHLAYFLLTLLLLDTLKASAPARIVNVASGYQRPVDFDDLQNARDYNGWEAYGRSKLMNVMFTFALARRLGGQQVTANCLHPGTVRSNFQRAAGIGPMGRRTPEQGADTLVYLATSPDVAEISGAYFMDRRQSRANRQAYDIDAQEQLWRESKRLLGLE